MTTTSSFQIKPDFYTTEDDCKNNSKNTLQTNKRYKNFNQTHFTAGDEEQFNDYRDETNGCDKYINIENNIFINQNFAIWSGYHNLETTCVLNTFKYIFNKFKKGIYVKILNNEIKVFLPFSNSNFINEWSHLIKYDKKIFKKVSEIEGRIFNEKKVNDFVNTWYANNCLLRYEFPINEGDTNVSCIKNMLEELCKNRNIPDIEFYVNRRDFPILTTKYSEPYYDIWGSDNVPLVSHKYDNYLPIFSMSKTSNYADILFPTHEDWANVQIKENKFFTNSRVHLHSNANHNIKWKDKKNIAVFRGSSTGSGLTIDNNQRLHISYLSSLNKIDNDDGNYYLDAGITKWNTRIKKLKDKNELQIIDIDSLPFSLVPQLCYDKQLEYKYIIHIDGHVSAFRLSYQLGMNSLILLVESDWKLWYMHLLKPYVHYIPIKRDLSDIYTQIKWCKINDTKCQEIVNNANEFYKKYLDKNGILDYLQKLLIDVKEQTGTYYYNCKSILSLQQEEQLNILQIYKNKYPKDSDEKCLNSIPIHIGRCYGLLKGIQYIINYLGIELYKENKDKVFENNSVEINKLKLKNYNLILKVSKNQKKEKENIHESFIGITCINKILKNIPNFCFIYALDNDNSVISEYIRGERLFEYIKSDKFSLKIYINVLYQLCLALQVAQNECCFVHYDLTPWNIIIQFLDEEVDIEYQIDYNKIIKIRTNVVPIIIDYGKSHVIYKNKHYGFVNMYKFSTSHDIISFILTSIYQIIIEQNVVKEDFSTILYISNFLSGTKYYNKHFNNAKDVKMFFRNAKKYSNLLYNDKYELEYKTPMDLFYYLQKRINYVKINYLYSYSSFMNKSYPYQIFHYILSKNNNEQMNSFIKSLKRIKKIKINISIKLFYINLITNDIISYGFFNSDIKNLIHKILKYLSNNIDRSTKKEIKYKDKYDNDFVINFDENIFLEPYKLKELLNVYSKYDIKKMIKKLNNLVDNNHNKITLNNSIANIKTLFSTTETLYFHNIKNINKEIYKYIYNFVCKINNNV